jgi:5-methylcytosine-specific restriction enzyme subunit McrC
VSDFAQQRTIITLNEWETREDAVQLAPEDGRLVQSLRATGDTRLGIDELRSGLRLSARSWVGVVRFSNFEVRILPKMAGGNVGLVKLVDYAAGLEALDRHPADHSIDAEGLSLFDLVALLLAKSCERISRSGLLADYKETESDLPVVRGRLMVRAQVLKRFGMINRLECRYDDQTTDISENQILLTALTIAAPRVSNSEVALRIRRLMAIFSEACTLDDFDLRLARVTLIYNRLNEHYREAHGLAWLLLDGAGIDDLYAGTGYRTFAFLLDMNRLFEDFITRWVTWLLTGTEFRARPQQRDRTILWNADLGRPYTNVIPDILVESKSGPRVSLPIDAKYKLYDQKTISTSDIYQSFLYAFAYGQSHSVLPTSLILYPASSDVPTFVRLHVRQAAGRVSAELRGLGIYIPDALIEAAARRVGRNAQSLLESIRSCFYKPQPNRM